MLAGRTLIRVFPFALLLTFSEAAAASNSESFTFTVRGAVARTIDGRREMLGLIALEVPLDRMAAPSKLAFADKNRSEKLKSDEPAESAPEPLKPEAASAPKNPAETGPLPAPVLGIDLAAGALRAAFRASGHRRTERRYESLSSRARSSAILPELRLRAARTTDESMRYSPTITDPYRYTQAGGVTVAFEAQATWKLDRLVFADEEVEVEHLRRYHSRSEARLVDQVMKALFEWQRAVFAIQRTDLTPEEHALAALRLVEAEVRLDILTAGWFSAHAPRVRPASEE